MTITAKVVAHSRSPFHSMGVRDISTFLLRYPRFIHSEVMTHRTFSRNASSSRAIPVERLIQDVIDDPAIPVHWGKNQPGMQAHETNYDLIYDEFCSPLDMLDNRYEGVTARSAWLKARDNAVSAARAFSKAGYHKQIANRLLEPFAHINVVVTATDFDNFFWQRRHRDAQPEIRELANAMFQSLSESVPKVIKTDAWHLPFVSDDEQASREPDDLLKVSVARCARTSYMTHDKRVPLFDEDVQLYSRLVGSEPLHASPAEHQAKPQVPSGWCDLPTWSDALRGNFDCGWIQYRKTLPREHCDNYIEWSSEAAKEHT